MDGFTKQELEAMTPEERTRLAEIDKELSARPSALKQAGEVMKKGAKFTGEVIKGLPGVLNPFGQTVDPSTTAARGPGSTARQENILGIASELATPENVGGVAGGEAGRRTGGEIGRKIGGSIPGGPITKAAGSVGGYYVGSLAGRLGGAYLGGAGAKAGTDVLFGFTPTSEEELDNWFKMLHENGRQQFIGEAVGAGLEPVGAAARSGYNRLVHAQKGTSSLDVKAIAGWVHDNFKRAYHEMEMDSAAVRGRSQFDIQQQGRFKETINPTEAGRAIELSGMTVPEKMDSRILDVFQGISAGSMAGGAPIRHLNETRDRMAGLTALQIGMDVGDSLDPADLYTVVQSQVGEKFEKALTKGGRSLNVNEYVSNVMGNAMLNQANPGQMVKIYKNVVSTNPTVGHRFAWLSNMAGSNIDVATYKQYRDQLMKIRRNPKLTDEYRFEAQRMLGLLDRGIERQLTPGSRDILRSIQKVEAGKFDNDMRAQLVKGLLLAKNGPRATIDGLTSKPDYKKLTFLLDLIPDADVQNSLRREVVNKLLGTSLVPGGDLSSAALSKRLEITFGREAMEKITSKDTVNAIDKLIQYRQHLEGYKARGEPGRVMVALTQGTQIAGLISALGSGGLLNSLLGEYDQNRGGPGLAAGIGLMLGPRYIAKMLTSPYVNQYVKFAKLASSGRATPSRLRAGMTSLLEASGDYQLAEHLGGRAANVKWGEAPGDAEAEAYMRDKYSPAPLEEYNTPDPSFQRNAIEQERQRHPGNIYPEGVSLGR